MIPAAFQQVANFNTRLTRHLGNILDTDDAGCLLISFLTKLLNPPTKLVLTIPIETVFF